jgi:hypothetical protein
MLLINRERLLQLQAHGHCRRGRPGGRITISRIAALLPECCQQLYQRAPSLLYLGRACLGSRGSPVVREVGNRCRIAPRRSGRLSDPAVRFNVSRGPLSQFIMRHTVAWLLETLRWQLARL